MQLMALPWVLKFIPSLKVLLVNETEEDKTCTEPKLVLMKVEFETEAGV